MMRENKRGRSEPEQQDRETKRSKNTCTENTEQQLLRKPIPAKQPNHEHRMQVHNETKTLPATTEQKPAPDPTKQTKQTEQKEQCQHDTNTHEHAGPKPRMRQTI